MSDQKRPASGCGKRRVRAASTVHVFGAAWPRPWTNTGHKTVAGSAETSVRRERIGAGRTSAPTLADPDRTTCVHRRSG